MPGPTPARKCRISTSTSWAGDRSAGWSSGRGRLACRRDRDAVENLAGEADRGGAELDRVGRLALHVARGEPGSLCRARPEIEHDEAAAPRLLACGNRHMVELAPTTGRLGDQRALVLHPRGHPVILQVDRAALRQAIDGEHVAEVLRRTECLRPGRQVEADRKGTGRT